MKAIIVVPRAIPSNVRKAVLADADGLCAYCWCDHDKLQIDHVYPISRGGTNEIENLVAACVKCNYFKSDHLLEDLGPIWPLQSCPKLALRFGMILGMHCQPIDPDLPLRRAVDGIVSCGAQADLIEKAWMGMEV